MCTTYNRIARRCETDKYRQAVAGALPTESFFLCLSGTVSRQYVRLWPAVTGRDDKQNAGKPTSLLLFRTHHTCCCRSRPAGNTRPWSTTGVLPWQITTVPTRPAVIGRLVILRPTTVARQSGPRVLYLRVYFLSGQFLVSVVHPKFRLVIGKFGSTCGKR